MLDYERREGIGSSSRREISAANDRHRNHGDEFACIWVRSLVSGMPKPMRLMRQLIVLQIFIDDSGRGQEDAPAFVLAGYIARVQNWANFADRWQRFLTEEPAIEYLKGYDAYHCAGEFAGFSQKERDAKVLKGVRLLNQFTRARIVLRITKRDFDRMLQHEGVLKKIYAPVVAFLTLGTLAHLKTQKTLEKVDFVFDRGMLHSKVFEAAFDKEYGALPKAAYDLLARRPHMEDDKEFLPLQGADLLASYFRYSILNGEHFGSPIWKALEQKEVLDLSLNKQRLLELSRTLWNDKVGWGR